MREIERKILGINKAALTARIKKLRPVPKKLFEGLVRVKYFDFPDHRIRKKHDLLRLREFHQKNKKPYTELVYKIYECVKSGCKYYDELELCFPGTFNQFEDLFKRLGVNQTLYYEKKRTLFAWGKIKFEIDEHPRIPAFLEIEAPSPREIERSIKLLKLQNHEQTPETIGQLIKRKYPAIELNGLKW